jgi:hypothetical protein
MRILAEISEELETEKHVFVPEWTLVRIAVVVMA